MNNPNLKPQEVIVCESSDGVELSFTRLPDSQINFNLFEPGKRYLVNYEMIDDTLEMPGIAKFTIGRVDGSKEDMYGLNGPNPNPQFTKDS